MGETLHKRGIRKHWKRDIGRKLLKYSEELISRNSNFDLKLSPRTYIPSRIMYPFLLGHVCNLDSPLDNPLKAQFFHQFSYKFIVLGL